MGNINKSVGYRSPIGSNNRRLSPEINKGDSKSQQCSEDDSPVLIYKQATRIVSESDIDTDNQTDQEAAPTRTLPVVKSHPLPNESQMDIVKRTWVKLKDNDDLGSSLFLRMFESYPDLQSAFGSLGEVSQEDSHYGDVLRAHGSRVLGIVKYMIEQWSNQDAVINRLHQLGQHHVILNAKVDYLDIVSQMFLFALEAELNTEWNCDVELAWGALLRFLTHVMKEQMTF